MKVKLVFEDWRQVGKADSIYNSQLGAQLSASQLHSGSTFDAEITVDAETEARVRRAWDRAQAYPVFAVMMEDES